MIGDVGQIDTLTDQSVFVQILAAWNTPPLHD